MPSSSSESSSQSDADSRSGSSADSDGRRRRHARRSSDTHRHSRRRREDRSRSKQRRSGGTSQRSSHVRHSRDNRPSPSPSANGERARESGSTAAMRGQHREVIHLPSAECVETRVASLAAIESDGFSAGVFVSRRRLKHSNKPATATNTSDSAPQPATTVPNTSATESSSEEQLCHPALLADPEEKEKRWVQTLLALRRKYGVVSS